MPPSAARTSPARRFGRRREAAHALAAELSKLRSQPAVRLTLIGTWCVHLLLSFAFTQAEAQSPGGPQSWLDIGLASFPYAQAGFIVLGVLAACSEYNGGQLRTTLLAMPRRGLQFMAAQLALALWAVPAALIVIASGIGLAAVLADASSPLDAGRLAAALAGATGALALTTLLGAAVGALLRQTLSAAAVMLGLYFVAGPILRGRIALAKYLPDAAGIAMWQPQSAQAPHTLAPAQGALCLILWTLAALILAAIVYRRRDI
ncbi:ABC transporter permease [Cohnella sp. 56]|uniref:ABC transporter permease n=1 Tax=Cohnella sp. 56 TaxID=3113722 RepID=UPI0030E911AF